LPMISGISGVAIPEVRTRKHSLVGLFEKSLGAGSVGVEQN
jgi:hypothetical protein